MPLPSEYMPRLPLRFRPDGGFRILMMSDLHHAPNTGDAVIRNMRALIGRVKPDFVMLGGDNTVGRSTKADFERLLSEIASPMEEERIPWAHVFGNHDESPGLPKTYQQTAYESYPHCVSKAGPTDIPGTGNYFLPVMGSNGEPIFGIWGLDSQQDFKSQSDPLDYPGDLYWDLLMPNRIASGSDSDFVRFEQVMWYWNASREIERALQRKLPSLMALHIPLYEFNAVLQNAARTQMRGEYNERVSASELNSGLFAAALQRGDVKGIFAGHDHINTFDGVYCGIRVGLCGSIGDHGYGARDNDPAHDRERLRGGRVFDIREDDPWNIFTKMVFVNDAKGDFHP